MKSTGTAPFAEALDPRTTTGRPTVRVDEHRPARLPHRGGDTRPTPFGLSPSKPRYSAGTAAWSRAPP
jgi:hypothetical protein